MKYALFVIALLASAPAFADVAPGPGCDCGGGEGEGDAAAGLVVFGALALLKRWR